MAKTVSYKKFSDPEYDLLIQNRDKVMRRIKRLEKKLIQKDGESEEGTYPAYKEKPTAAYQDYLVYLQRLTEGMLQKMKVLYGDLAL